MKNPILIHTLFILIMCCSTVFGQPILVNSLDDVNDGSCDANHCSLREAILLANTYIHPEITFEIPGNTPMPWSIKPTTNLPAIQSNNSNFNFSIMDLHGSDIVISGSQLPGKTQELDYALLINTNGNVAVKGLLFRDCSRGILVKNVDTLVIGGGALPKGGNAPNVFLFNKNDLYFDGLYKHALIQGNIFGADRQLNKGIGAGEIGIKCINGNTLSGTMIIGDGGSPDDYMRNFFCGHTNASIDLQSVSNVTIEGNYFDMGRNAHSIVPASKNNIRLTKCKNSTIIDNYLGATDKQIFLDSCHNVKMEYNHLGTINYYLDYPMKYGIVINHCEDIRVGSTDLIRANRFNGHSENSIHSINSRNIHLIYNEIGIYNGINNSNIINGIMLDNTNNTEVIGNLFLGSVEDCIHIINSDSIHILKNDFSVLDYYPVGSTGIHLTDARDIWIGDSTATGNNIFTRLNKGIEIDGTSSNRIFNFQNSFFCNLDKGFTILDSANHRIKPPDIFKRSGSVVFGQALPLSLIQIYSHETRCPQSPCQGKEFLGSTYTDAYGYWEYDFNGMMSGSKTFTTTSFQSGTSEFSTCIDVSTITQMTLTKAGSECEAATLRCLLNPLPAGVQYMWSGPNGFSSSEPVVNAQFKGWYHLEVTHPTWNYSLKDSIFILPKTSSTYTINSTLCSGKSFTLEGHVFDEKNPQGQFISQYKNDAGCDSIIVVNLQFTPSIEIEINPTLCPSETYTVGDSTFSYIHPEGIVVLKAFNPDECDTIVHVKIDYIMTHAFQIDTIVCKDEIVELYGQTLTESEPKKLINLNIVGQSGCDSVVLVNVDFISPEPTIKKIMASCSDTLSGSIILNIGASLFPPYTVFINNMLIGSFSETNIELTGLESGTHDIVLSDKKGCKSELIQVNIPQHPINEVTTLNELDLPIGLPYQIKLATTLSNQSIAWSTEQYLSCSDCFEPIIIPYADQTYQYQIVDKNGCNTFGSIHVHVHKKDQPKIFVPNIFSPNGDGYNDLLEVSYADLTLQSIHIFNRWGGVVYASDTNFSWDGTSQNQLVDVGAYVYIVTFKLPGSEEDKSLKGLVCLIK